MWSRNYAAPATATEHTARRVDAWSLYPSPLHIPGFGNAGRPPAHLALSFSSKEGQQMLLTFTAQILLDVFASNDVAFRRSAFRVMRAHDEIIASKGTVAHPSILRFATKSNTSPLQHLIPSNVIFLHSGAHLPSLAIRYLDGTVNNGTGAQSHPTELTVSDIAPNCTQQNEAESATSPSHAHFYLTIWKCSLESAQLLSVERTSSQHFDGHAGTHHHCDFFPFSLVSSTNHRLITDAWINFMLAIYETTNFAFTGRTRVPPAR